MKKIIDSGALRSDLLKKHLSANPKNMAVICDYASMELFKGNPTINARKSLEILSNHPKQVIILHGTSKISRMHPKATGLQARFIDNQQTKSFRYYCHSIFNNKSDPEKTDQELLRKGQISKQRQDLISKDIETIREGIQMLEKSFNVDDLKRLKRHEQASPDFMERMGKDILLQTALFLKKLGLPPTIPFEKIKYSFPFRYAVCSYAQTLRWIANGGVGNTPQNKLNNDYVDMTYAAYATFYDGVISRDQKLLKGYSLARGLLKMFGC